MQHKFSDLLATGVAVKQLHYRQFFGKFRNFTAAAIASVKAEVKRNT